MNYDGYEYKSIVDEDDLPYRFRPLGAWNYFWFEILFSIPVIGLIFAIVFACGGCENINLRNFARSRFCGLAIGLIVAGIVLAFLFMTGLLGSLS